MGVLLWIFSFTQAHLLGPISAALPAVVSGFTAPFVLSLSWLITRKKFAFTTSYVAYGCIATFNLVMGPPGIHKIFLTLIAGIAFDLTLWGVQRVSSELIKLYIAFMVFTIVSMANYVGAFIVLDLPGKDKLLDTVFAFAAVFFIEGLISIAVALFFYNQWLSTIPTIQEWASSEQEDSMNNNSGTD